MASSITEIIAKELLQSETFLSNITRLVVAEVAERVLGAGDPDLIRSKGSVLESAPRTPKRQAEASPSMQRQHARESMHESKRMRRQHARDGELCFRCHEPGHTAKCCPNKQAASHVAWVRRTDGTIGHRDDEPEPVIEGAPQ